MVDRLIEPPKGKACDAPCCIDLRWHSRTCTHLHYLGSSWWRIGRMCVHVEVRTNLLPDFVRKEKKLCLQSCKLLQVRQDIPLEANDVA